MRKLLILIMLAVYSYGVDACHIRITTNDDSGTNSKRDRVRVIDTVCLDGYLYSVSLSGIRLVDLRPILVYRSYDMRSKLKSNTIGNSVAQKTCKCPGYIEPTPGLLEYRQE